MYMHHNVCAMASDCTSWLAHSNDSNCQLIWKCGTDYDRQLHASTTSTTHCKDRLAEHNIPSKPTMPCMYNITSQQCQYTPGKLYNYTCVHTHIFTNRYTQSSLLRHYWMVINVTRYLMTIFTIQYLQIWQGSTVSNSGRGVIDTFLC